jgi:hypothetical protein
MNITRKQTLIALAGLALLGSPATATVILLEDFEDSTVTYTSTAIYSDPGFSSLQASNFEGSDGAEDYFGRSGPGGISTTATLSNVQGSGWFGANHTESIPTGTGSYDFSEIIWSGLDISTITDDLQFSALFAQTSKGYSTVEGGLVDVAVQIDGGGYQTIFRIASDAGSQLRIDTNLDGTGEGTAITDTFTKYSSSTFSPTGNTLDLRIRMSGVNGPDENIAFDDISITAIPEPSTFALVGITGLAAAIALRRRRY